MEHYSITDIGLHRAKNQDAYLVCSNSNGDLLAIVCDGIGGAKAGEVASSETVSWFEKNFADSKAFSDLNQAGAYLLNQIDKANYHVYDLSRKFREYEGMGTTLTGLYISSNGILSLNVGDSRVYGFTDGKMYRLTSDHTLVNEMLKNGEITYEESLNHPKRHYLVKAIGVTDSVEPDVHRVQQMEKYLICSDGLHGYVSESEILTIMNDPLLDCQSRTEKLRDLALLKGGYDNITIIVVEC